MIKLDLYWSDLTPEAQQYVIDMLGDKPDWEHTPFYSIELEEEGDSDNEQRD